MYADRKKSQKVYVESKCVSRDDCCWDETPDTETVVHARWRQRYGWTLERVKDKERVENHR
jgi:hypothetical protein